MVKHTNVQRLTVQKPNPCGEENGRRIKLKERKAEHENMQTSPHSSRHDQLGICNDKIKGAERVNIWGGERGAQNYESRGVLMLGATIRHRNTRGKSMQERG
jgi:hypothetical protein